MIRMKSRLFLILLGLVLPVSLFAQESSSKVGYASIDYIITQLPDVKVINAELQSTRNQLRTQIDARTEQVQKQYQDLMASARTLPDTVLQRRQQEVQQAMAELDQMQQDAQQTLTNKQKLLMAPLYLQVNRAIKEVASENGFEVVLTERLGGMPFLLYQDSTYNISDLVVQKLTGGPGQK